MFGFDDESSSDDDEDLEAQVPAGGGGGSRPSLWRRSTRLSDEDGDDGRLEAQVPAGGVGRRGGGGLVDQARAPPPQRRRGLLSFFASPTQPAAAADGSYDQQTGSPGTGPTSAGTATNILSRATKEGGASDSSSPADGTSAPGGEDQLSTVRFAGGAGSGARGPTAATRRTAEQLRWVSEQGFVGQRSNGKRKLLDDDTESTDSSRAGGWFAWCCRRSPILLFLLLLLLAGVTTISVILTRRPIDKEEVVDLDIDGEEQPTTEDKGNLNPTESPTASNMPSAAPSQTPLLQGCICTPLLVNESENGNGNTKAPPPQANNNGPTNNDSGLGIYTIAGTTYQCLPSTIDRETAMYTELTICVVPNPVLGDANLGGYTMGG